MEPDISTAQEMKADPNSVLSSFNSNETSNPNSKRIRYNLENKAKVLYFHKQGNSINKCAKHLSIDRRLISKWIKLEPTILSTKLKCKKYAVPSSTNKSHFPTMETHLYNWIMENRIKGVCLSGTVIKAKAAEFYHQYYVLTNQSNVEFKSSSGWFTNFCKRKNLVLRRITTSGRDLPYNTIEIVRIFFTECQILVNSPDFEPGFILNMDETSIYLDFPSNYTFEEKGTKRIKSITNVAERVRLSAAFSATADDEKLPVYVLVPRKSDLPNYTPPNNV
ncbi:unnamed protein product, partial [Brachionus calyciflorus]